MFTLTIVACMAISAVALGIMKSATDEMRREEDQMSQQVTQARTENDQALKSVSNSQATMMRQTTGYDAAKVKSDTDTIEAFLKTVFTWDSCASYNKAREDAMQTYGVRETSQFFTDYMPHIEEYGTAAHGERVPNANAIDSQNLSLTLGDATIYATADRKDSQGTYEYVALCDIHTQETGTSNGQSAVVCFQVDEGGIVDVSAQQATVS
jgi:hypothetical protein